MGDRALTKEEKASVICGGSPSHCNIQRRFAKKEKKFGVRCCSENEFPLSQKNEGCDVFAGSFGVDGKCSGLLTYDQACKFCEGLGARLCTEAELLNKCARGTGCELNKKLVWGHCLTDANYL